MFHALLPHTLPWLPLAAIQPWLPLMTRRGVSVVARGPGGFLAAWRAARGVPERLGIDPGTGQPWAQRRAAFIARHEAQRQAAREPLWGPDGFPTRRHLALIAWAWSPAPAELARRAARA